MRQSGTRVVRTVTVRVDPVGEVVVREAIDPTVRSPAVAGHRTAVPIARDAGVLSPVGQTARKAPSDSEAGTPGIHPDDSRRTQGSDRLATRVLRAPVAAGAKRPRNAVPMRVEAVQHLAAGRMIGRRSIVDADQTRV